MGQARLGTHLCDQRREAPARHAQPLQRRRVCDAGAVYELHCQHALAGQAVVDGRDVHPAGGGRAGMRVVARGLEGLQGLGWGPGQGGREGLAGWVGASRTAGHGRPQTAQSRAEQPPRAPPRPQKGASAAARGGPARLPERRDLGEARLARQRSALAASCRKSSSLQHGECVCVGGGCSRHAQPADRPRPPLGRDQQVQNLTAAGWF